MTAPPDRWIFAATLVALLFGAGCLEAQARSFRVSRIPNGIAANCANCHVNPSGGGTRTAFGAAVNTAIGGTSANVAFWDATLAALDSDGDGVTNGAELLDPDGDGTPTSSVGATNPGNRPPVLTTNSLPTATMGVSYTFQATASDAETNGITYSKAGGPAWLSVSSSGALSGIPPLGSSGSIGVTLRVTDFGTSTRGYSLSSTTRNYTLTVISSYSGWQALTFTLPGEAVLAAPLADPDFDGLSNLLEYAVRLPARTVSAGGAFPTTVDGAGHLAMVFNVRDDDPKLSLVMEASDNPGFTAPTTISPTITDAIPGDGVFEYTFVDSTAPAQSAGRFVRIRAALLP